MLPALRLLVLEGSGGLPIGLGPGLVRLGRLRPQLWVVWNSYMLPSLSQFVGNFG